MTEDETTIKCPECNAEVGTTAEACPQCGKQLMKKQGINPGTIGLLVLLAAAAVGAWLWQSGN